MLGLFAETEEAEPPGSSELAIRFLNNQASRQIVSFAAMNERRKALSSS